MNSRRADGIIGSELVVHGKLGGKSDLRIDGVFEGEVVLEGTLTVGPEASLVGPLSVAELTVEGEVRGDVAATDGVVVRPGGRLIGDVRARRIGIEDGGSLQGGIEMDFEVPGGGAT